MSKYNFRKENNKTLPHIIQCLSSFKHTWLYPTNKTSLKVGRLNTMHTHMTHAHFLH